VVSFLEVFRLEHFTYFSPLLRVLNVPPTQSTNVAPCSQTVPSLGPDISMAVDLFMGLYECAKNT